MKPLRELLLLVGTGLLLAACGSAPLPDGDAYFLVPPQEDPEARPVEGAPDLQIADVDAAGHLQGIAILRPDKRLDTLVYHRLAAPIEETVSAWMQARLLATGRFREVVGPRSVGRTKLRLGLKVARFEIVERAEGLATAHVHLEGVVTDEKRSVVWSGWTEGRSPVHDTELDVPALVAALERALDVATREMAAEIAAEPSAAPSAPTEASEAR